MPTPSNSTPTKVTLKVEEVLTTHIAGCTEYIIYVNGQEYKELPLDANVREPNEKKSKPYKDMCKTLSDSPKDFFDRNLGISVVATSVKQVTKKKYELEFDNGTGILNGGHTQLAILNSQGDPGVKNAIIRLTVKVKKYTLSQIAQIAAAQNSSTGVKEYSLAEKQGLFNPIKAHLDGNKEKHIIWYEGRSVAANKGLEASDLIAILNVFNVNHYFSRYCSSTSQPVESSNTKTGVFKKWENASSRGDFEIIYPLINDILDLYELIKLKFADGSGMSKLNIIKDTKGRGKELIFGTDICPYEIPKQMLYPLLAAYRSNVYYDATTRKIGWFVDNKVLFDSFNKELCKQLINSFSANGNQVNKFSKDPTLWGNLYYILRDHVDAEFSKTGKVFVEYDI